MKRNPSPDLKNIFAAIQRPFYLVTAAAIFLLSGCGTVYFTNGQQSHAEFDKGAQHTMMHHAAIMETIEISPPVNIGEQCENHEWQEITIEKSFWNGFLPTLILNPPFINLYGVWTVSTNCKD